MPVQVLNKTISTSMPVQVLNKTIRDDIYRLVLTAVRREASDPANLTGLCLEFAWQGYLILKDWPGAPRTLIQAGSAQWPRIPPERDDGVSPTHFAYEWDPDSDLGRLARAGISPVIRRGDRWIAASLPEMHIWLGCPGSGEILDFTTGLWPAACLATIGEEWLAPPPPDYLWTFGTRLPPGVNYLADRDAIDTVIAVLRQQDRQYP
jgi:hypothetical protein